MKSTDNKKIIIIKTDNNNYFAVSVSCGCLCDSLFIRNRKIKMNFTKKCYLHIETIFCVLHSKF